MFSVGRLAGPAVCISHGTRTAQSLSDAAHAAPHITAIAVIVFLIFTSYGAFVRAHSGT